MFNMRTQVVLGSAKADAVEGTGIQALKFLMEQHGLKQADMHEIGSQGVVSEILAGKRDLNIRQVRALSERFGVSPATFV
jgi:HTH-type transcriptional regulator/antitoxin HigA